MQSNRNLKVPGSFSTCIAEPFLQEMVVFGGVNPEADLNDVQVWRPHPKLAICADMEERHAGII